MINPARLIGNKRSCSTLLMPRRATQSKSCPRDRPRGQDLDCVARRGMSSVEQLRLFPISRAGLIIYGIRFDASNCELKFIYLPHKVGQAHRRISEESISL